jgi:hypothetical protein
MVALWKPVVQKLKDQLMKYLKTMYDKCVNLFRMQTDEILCTRIINTSDNVDFKYMLCMYVENY